MTYEMLEFNNKNGIATLTFNRQSVYNALNEQIHTELKDALAIIKQDTSIRTLVITGKGKAFCTGQDLNERKQSQNKKVDLGESIERKYMPLIMSLNDLKIPTIAYVNGVCAGAGVGIALSCDIVVACEEAYFLQAFCKIGLIPDSANTYFLPRLVGLAKAKELCLLGEKITAQEALRLGLIARVYDKDTAPSEVSKLAKHFASAPTLGLSLIKQALNQSLDNSLQEQLLVEKTLQQQAGFSDDYREGVNAFFEKRQPIFKGK